jgi:hypothetical protein
MAKVLEDELADLKADVARARVTQNATSIASEGERSSPPDGENTTAVGEGREAL